MKNIIVSLGCSVVLTVGIYAQSSVWKVETDNGMTYLGGTCHVLRKADYPLPDEFMSAYEESDTLVFETDISKLSSTEVQMMFLQKGAYRDGTTLESVLSAETYSALGEYCAKAGLPLSLPKVFGQSLVVSGMSLEIV